jgi:hypothetical protein
VLGYFDVARTNIGPFRGNVPTDVEISGAALLALSR